MVSGQARSRGWYSSRASPATQALNWVLPFRMIKIRMFDKPAVLRGREVMDCPHVVCQKFDVATLYFRLAKSVYFSSYLLKCCCINACMQLRKSDYPSYTQRNRSRVTAGAGSHCFIPERHCSCVICNTVLGLKFHAKRTGGGFLLLYDVGNRR